MKTVKIAFICPWQNHAEKFANLANTYPESEIVVVWDDNEKRGRAFADMIGCRFEPDYSALLSDSSIDGFIITSPIPQYTQLLLPAIKAGKHVFVEKPMAMENEQADMICEAIKEAGVHVTVSDPIFKPETAYLKRMTDEGRFGEVKFARVRIVFGDGVELLGDPELQPFVENRGGAMYDSHSAHVLSWLLGKPISATSVFNKLSDYGIDSKWDVQSVAAYKFENGAIGVGEASYISPGSPYTVEIYGTKGCGKATREGASYNIDNAGWVNAPKEDLPEAYPYPLNYWVKSVYNDTPNELYSAEEAKHVTAMISAVHRSEGRSEPIY